MGNKGKLVTVADTMTANEEHYSRRIRVIKQGPPAKESFGEELILSQPKKVYITVSGSKPRLHNNRFMEQLGYTPKQILLGCSDHQLGHLEQLYPTPTSSSILEWVTDRSFKPLTMDELALVVWDFMERRENTRERVIFKNEKYKESMKRQHDQGVKERSFNLRDLCMLWDISMKGIGGKLQPRWRGPFIVEGYAGEHHTSYLLRQINGNKIMGSHHGDHLSKIQL